MRPLPLPAVERHQFTAVDVGGCCAVVGDRASASAGTAALLDELVARMPVPVRAIQGDGGSEFMATFETACRDRGISLYVRPPRSPKLNGSARREFWECYEGDLDLPALPALHAARRQWEEHDATVRPPQALGYRTPAAFLSSQSFSNVSN